jgi:hypothetical protein
MASSSSVFSAMVAMAAALKLCWHVGQMQYFSPVSMGHKVMGQSWFLSASAEMRRYVGGSSGSSGSSGGSSDSSDSSAKTVLLLAAVYVFIMKVRRPKRGSGRTGRTLSKKTSSAPYATSCINPPNIAHFFYLSLSGFFLNHQIQRFCLHFFLKVCVCEMT